MPERNKKHVEIFFVLKPKQLFVAEIWGRFFFVGWFWCFGTEVVRNWSLTQLPAPSTISKFHEGGSRGPVVGKAGKVERW